MPLRLAPPSPRLGTLTAPLALLASLGASCGTSQPFWRPVSAASAREAGSVHLTVLSVAPWSHYVGALQPDFSLTAQDALSHVVIDTRRVREASLESTSLGISGTYDEAGEAGVPLTSTLTGIQRNPPWEAIGSGPDAMTQFWAATALYQEVQLLNRYVRDAAIPAGYRAFVVRLQISLMPRRRHQPYDVYTTLSVFEPSTASPGSADGVPGGGRRGELEKPLTRMRGEALASADHGGPCVLPLLVTDNLESSLESRSSESLRQLALSLSMFSGKEAGSLDFSQFADQFRSLEYGRDLNSLLTVARVSENTLRVRLGAMQSATADYAIVPRNHNVTLLVMVGEEAPPVLQLVAKTVLVDTRTGEELSGASDEQITAALESVSVDYALEGMEQGALERLLERVQRNDQQGFYDDLRVALGPEHPSLEFEHSLWIDLVSLLVGSQYSSTLIELRGQGDQPAQSPKFFRQTALVRDDGRERASVVLRGARLEDASEIDGTLEVRIGENVLRLPAERVEADAAQGTITLDFPSLYGLGSLDELRRFDAIQLVLEWAGDLDPFEAVYIPPPMVYPSSQPSPSPSPSPSPTTPPVPTPAPN